MLLALAMHPEIQAKARAEVEAVVGTDRFIQPNDLERLPYVKAIVREAGRWHVIVPLCMWNLLLSINVDSNRHCAGVPHMSTSDDEYKGYFIPAGTVIMPNAWSVSSQVIMMMV